MSHQNGNNDKPNQNQNQNHNHNHNNNHNQNQKSKSLFEKIIEMNNETIKTNYKTHRNTLNALLRISPPLSKSLTPSQLHSLWSLQSL